MGAPRKKRILYRIILPFTVLFAVTSLLSWFFSVTFITHYLDRDLQQQMERVTRVISRSSYVLNPAILRQMKEVVNGELILAGKDGRLINATIQQQELAGFAAALMRGVEGDRTVTGTIDFQGEQYRVVVRPVQLSVHGQTYLSLWIPASDVNSLKIKIVFVLAGMALLGILAMAAAGYRLARTITAPVEQLVEVTERVSGGQRQLRALVRSQDEIGELAEAFNRMIARLDGFEQKLVETEKLATAGQMAAGLAHEVRNPLTSIKMFVQVLHGRMGNQPRNQQMLELLEKEIDRLDMIIGQIVERVRPGALSRRPADICHVLQEVLAIAGETLKSADIRIDQHLDVNLPMISIDPEKMKQVFWNLILNARDAMPTGGSLAINVRQSGQGAVEILFEDSGQGLAGQDGEVFFQSFFTTKPEGLGLGLSMGRKIVAQHSGSLTLENRPEGGVRARIILPLEEVPV